MDGLESKDRQLTGLYVVKRSRLQWLEEKQNTGTKSYFLTYEPALSKVHYFMWHIT